MASRTVRRALLLIAAAAGLAVCASAQSNSSSSSSGSGAAASLLQAVKQPKQQQQPFNYTNILNTTHVPIIRVPSLAPSVLEVLRAEGVRGDMPQNLTHPKPLKLSEIMPKLPQIPAFAVPEFGPNTTDADLIGNVTAATKSLLTPLVESTMLPSYGSGLAERVSGEVAWLRSFASDAGKQQAMCGFFGPANAGNCAVFAANMQRTKIQALSAGLEALRAVEAQLNEDMARKLAAFNRPSPHALGGNWLCEVGGDLETAISDAAARAGGDAYAAKARGALAKVRDFTAGRWAASPWWRMDANATAALPPLAIPCPVVA